MVNGNVIDLEQLFEDCKTKVRNMDDIIIRKQTQISRLSRENLDLSEDLCKIRKEVIRLLKENKKLYAEIETIKNEGLT